MSQMWHLYAFCPIDVNVNRKLFSQAVSLSSINQCLKKYVPSSLTGDKVDKEFMCHEFSFVVGEGGHVLNKALMPWERKDKKMDVHLALLQMEEYLAEVPLPHFLPFLEVP